MKLYELNVLNLRIRMPITAEKNPRNFITKITSYEKVCSIANSMTVLPDLLPCVLEMMKKRNENNMINDDWNTEDISEEKKCDNDL